MPAATRLKAQAHSAELMVEASADPKVAAASGARYHRARVAAAKTHNRRVTGELDIREKTFVDGRLGAPLESVKLDGGNITTVFPFPIREILEYVDYLLITTSPVGPPGGAGTYQRSHRLFADGVETDPENPDLSARTYVFTSNLPYARKIERGQGSAPKSGVYQGAVAVANRKFGNFAYIGFSFQAIVGGTTQDYAKVALGGRKKAKGASAAARAAQRQNVQQRYPAIRIRLK